MTASDDNARIDARVDLHARLSEFSLPLRLESTVFSFLRVAYINGYVDGMWDDPPLTEEIPMLRFPQLFLP